MSVPLIAVAIYQDGQVSPHPDRAGWWQVYATDKGTPEAVWQLKLSAAGSLNEWRSRGRRHPLFAVDVVICGGGGESKARELNGRGPLLVTTTEKDPLIAVIQYLAGKPSEYRPREQAAQARKAPDHAVTDS